MRSQRTANVSASRAACKFPGCEQAAVPEAEKKGATISAADDANPVTMAKVTGAELLRSLRAEADRISALGKELRERIDVLTDPTAAEAEVEAVRAAVEQMSEELTAAQNRATAAEERA